MSEPHRTEMTTEEFRSGLLWKINHDILHKYGLALGVESNVTGFCLLAIDEPWEFSRETNAEEPRRFMEWVERKQNEIPV